MKKSIKNLFLVFVLIIIPSIGFSQTRSMLERHAKDLDALLKIAKEQIWALQIRAQLYYTLPDKPTPVWFQYLKNNSSGHIYSLDSVPPVLQEYTGNLTGIGTIEDRSDEFYTDIKMALVLYPQFVICMQLVPNAQWIYFTSVHRFSYVYPWIPSSQNQFRESLHKEPFFVQGLPKNNPDRETYWTPIYLDEAGAGLMVTVSVPVYDANKFKGTVSLDLTLKELNQLLSQSKRPSKKTLVLLINDNQEVLACPTLNMPNNKIYMLNDLLPDPLKNCPELLQGRPENKMYEVKNYNVRYTILKHAPWKLLMIKAKE